MPTKKNQTKKNSFVKIGTYHHGDLKNTLIQAGIRLLNKVDAHDLSLREVAKEAQVSHAAPYRHFPDKETLLAAIAHQGFIKLGETVEKVLTKNQTKPHLWLQEIGLTYFRFAIANPAHFKVMTGGFVTDPKKYAEFEWVGKKVFDNIVGIIELSQKNGLIKIGDPLIITLGFWSMVHGFSMLHLVNQLNFLENPLNDIEDTLKKLIQVF
jgi:AcrR family transcriptional regulator